MGMGKAFAHQPSSHELWPLTPPSPPQILLFPVPVKKTPEVMSEALWALRAEGSVESCVCCSQWGAWKPWLCSSGASSHSDPWAAARGDGGSGGDFPPRHPPRWRWGGVTEVPTCAGEGEVPPGVARRGGEGGSGAGPRAVLAVPQDALLLQPPHRPHQLLVLRQQRLDLPPELVVAGEDRRPRARQAPAGHRLHGGTVPGTALRRLGSTHTGWQRQSRGHGTAPGSPRRSAGGCRERRFRRDVTEGCSSPGVPTTTTTATT